MPMNMTLGMGSRLELDAVGPYTPSGDTFFILQEDGFDILQEDGFRIVLEIA